MSIKFNILWFEDNEEWYDTNRENIEEYLKEKNFLVQFDHYESANNIEAITTLYECDLILVDLKLDNNTKGTNAISAIRGKNILSDALFYSSDGIDKIRNEMGTEIFEGVYFSSRDDVIFESKVESLIDKAIKKTENIISTRGLLVDCLSDFDEKLREIIFKFCSSFDNDEKMTELNKYTYDLIINQVDQNKNKCNDMNIVNFLLEAINSTHLIDSAKLARIVQHIFTKHYPQYNYRTDFYSTYCRSIILERNNLAHAKKETQGDGLFYFEKDGKRTIYSSEKCSEIRANINSFDEEINKMIDLIK